MKTIKFLRIAILFLTIAISCKTEEKQGYICNNGNCQISDNPQFNTIADCQNACGKSSAGYNCSSGNCISVDSGAQYSTLSACQTACIVNNGTVKIFSSWNSHYGNCNTAFTVVIGLGYTSTDVANEVYFAQSRDEILPPFTYTNSSLPPGVYYYKAKKTFNSHCGSASIPAVTRSDSFTVTLGQTTNVYAYF